METLVEYLGSYDTVIFFLWLISIIGAAFVAGTIFGIWALKQFWDNYVWRYRQGVKHGWSLKAVLKCLFFDGDPEEIFYRIDPK